MTSGFHKFWIIINNYEYDFIGNAAACILYFVPVVINQCRPSWRLPEHESQTGNQATGMTREDKRRDMKGRGKKINP